SFVRRSGHAKSARSTGVRLKSARGTYVPSIWQKEFPNWSFAMSLRPGSSVQPEFVTIDSTSIEAPQAGQLKRVPSVTSPHQGHVCVRVGPPCCAAWSYVIALGLLQSVWWCTYMD